MGFERGSKGDADSQEVRKGTSTTRPMDFPLSPTPPQAVGSDIIPVSDSDPPKTPQTFTQVGFLPGSFLPIFSSRLPFMLATSSWDKGSTKRSFCMYLTWTRERLTREPFVCATGNGKPPQNEGSACVPSSGFPATPRKIGEVPLAIFGPVNRGAEPER